MCGIIGVAQTIENGSGRIISEGLKRLEYRGYDSVGIAAIEATNVITVEKDKGAIDLVGANLGFNAITGKIAIGHSRWATHGAPSRINAHPHLSMNGKVAVIHNGIIENFYTIKQELLDLGYKFKSQTDTEVIPNLIEHYLNNGMKPLDAIKKLIAKIKGTFAIVMITTEAPSKIYAFKKDNPLVLGIGNGANYCASDIPAFLPYTKQVIILEEDELGILEAENYTIYNISTWETIQRKPHTIDWNPIEAEKLGYPHFMLKEIHEQPAVLKKQLQTQVDEFNYANDLINGAEKIIVIAAGTAYHAALSAYYSISKIAKKVVLPCIAAEWDSVAHLADKKTLIIACSQSGETLDTIKATKSAIKNKAKILSIVNVYNSTLTRLSDHVIYIHSGPEIGVAATKTYLALDYAVWRIALTLAESTNSLSNHELSLFRETINSIPAVVKMMIQTYEAKAREISKWLQNCSSIYYLGRGKSYASAREGALKMKEIAYIHAEGYPAGESKHGPIALVEDGFPVIFIAPKDETRNKIVGSIQEMKARGAVTIGIIEEDDEELKVMFDHYFEVPKGSSQYVSTIPYQIPLQFLAYFTSVIKGYNPDKPRNLAKSVTVE